MINSIPSRRGNRYGLRSLHATFDRAVSDVVCHIVPPALVLPGVHNVLGAGGQCLRVMGSMPVAGRLLR
jgi:hypothetical protein